jgi:peptidoglycan/xylan/chitin deacetylase (PgdA/CDA1 family)
VTFYHYVRDVAGSAYPDQKALSVGDFYTQMDWFARRRTVIDYATFEVYARRRTPLDGSALLTFDDGFVDHYGTVFPALRDRGWSGVFFLAGQTLDDPPRVINVHKTHFLIAKLGASGFAAAVRRELEAYATSHPAALERQLTVYRYDAASDAEVKHLLNYELPYDVADGVLANLFFEHFGDEAAFAGSLYLDSSRIAEMASAGMTFGFHTERHRVLSRLTADQQRQEVVRGVDLVRRLTGQSSVPFCFPYGHAHTYNAVTLETLDGAGYSTAFTTARRVAHCSTDAPFEIPRLDTRDLPPFTPETSYA